MMAIDVRNRLRPVTFRRGSRIMFNSFLWTLRGWDCLDPIWYIFFSICRGQIKKSRETQTKKHNSQDGNWQDPDFKSKPQIGWSLP